MSSGVASDLTKGPGSSGPDVVFGLVDQSILEGLDAFGVDDANSESLVEGGDVAERHDARQPGVALRVTDIIHQSSLTTGVGDELRELGRLLGDLPDAGRGILTDEWVNVLQAVENPWEDLGLHHHVSELHGMLGDLSEAGADVPLELGVGGVDERGEEGDGTSVDHNLSKLGGVLADFTEGTGRDSLERDLRLLDTEDQKWHGPGVRDGLGEVEGVPKLGKSNCGWRCT